MYIPGIYQLSPTPAPFHFFLYCMVIRAPILMVHVVLYPFMLQPAASRIAEDRFALPCNAHYAT